MLLALKGPCFLDLMEEMIEMIDLQTCTSLARLQSFFDGGDDYNFFQRCVSFAVYMFVVVVYLLVCYTAREFLFHCSRLNQVGARCLTFHSVVSTKLPLIP